LAVGRDKKLKEVTSKFEETYGKDTHLLTLKEFSPGDTMLREILSKHIILNGFYILIIPPQPTKR
jgi:hypothetical protein